jgi:HSP20 family molecular chaperone IbpA
MSETTMKNSENEKPERPTFAPPVDIYENNDAILILADLPGVSAEGLTVHLDKDQLTIAAHRALGSSGEEALDYSRVFVVPRGIDADAISANLENGVLRLSLPKPAALKPRQIEVKAG